MLDFVQCLQHTMLIWQPSGLASTWNQIPLTVGQWQVVPVALPQVHAAAGLQGVLPLGLCPPSRKT